MMRSDEVQGSRSPIRRRSAKVSSGLPSPIVPVPGVPSGTSGNKRRKESGLSWVSEPELRLIDPHPVKDDPQLAGLGDGAVERHDADGGRLQGNVQGGKERLVQHWLRSFGRVSGRVSADSPPMTASPRTSSVRGG